jgi:hypothetical protein
MPDFTEQLRAIADTREKCRQGDESLYRARVSLQKIKQDLLRAQQSQTVPQSDRDREIAALRAQVANVTSRLSSLREQSRQAAESLSELSDQENLVKHLRESQASTAKNIEALQRTIAELRHQDVPPADKLKLLQADLARQQSAQADLGAGIAKAATDLHQLQDRNGTLREKQAALTVQMESDHGKLRTLQQKLTDRLQPAFQNPQDLSDRQKQLEETISRYKSGLLNCSDKLGSAIGGLYHDPHPREALRNLEDRTPFLLFPVRIETIFVPQSTPAGQSNTELWVRIYPDDIAVHTHEKILTDVEVNAGELYWVELVVAQHLRAERDRRCRAAWSHLVELMGGPRASWVASQTKPSDWDSLAADFAAKTLIDFLLSIDRGFFDNLPTSSLSAVTHTALKNAVAANDGDAFSLLAENQGWFDQVNTAVRTRITGFPAQDLTKTDSWTRAPRTNILPDRFVLLLYDTDASAPREIPGAMIPDTVFLGPDPLDAKAAFTTLDNALTLSGNFDWISNFDHAIAQGMGFRVPLTDDEARVGFSKVLVLGVRLSEDASNSAAALAELIDNHQFGPKGFSIVAQGTATNNTQSNGTGYSDNGRYDDSAFFTAIDPPAFDPEDPNPKKSQTDGRLLADALSLPYSTLQTVQNAGRTDWLEANAMNTALFPTTLGYWLTTWMSRVIDTHTAELARNFFNKFVTGRGPLPSIRVGNQPYGVLVTSDMSRWKYPDIAHGGIVLQVLTKNALFLKNLSLLLSNLQNTWNTIASGLLFVGKENTDSSEVLMNILGLQPASVEFFQRIGYAYEYLDGLDSFQSGKRYHNELQSLIRDMPGTARVYLHQLGVEGETSTVGAMRSLHVLWQHYTASLDAANLVENKPLSESKQLTLNYIDWLAKANSTDDIIKEMFPAPPPSALLYAMLRNALLLQLYRGSYDWLDVRSDFDSGLQQAVKPNTLPGIRPSAPSLSKYEVMRTQVEAVEPLHPSPASSVSDWIWRGPVAAEPEAAFVKDQKSALSLLAGVSTAALQRCFVEHLDCCNYRLDAWQTGLIAQRLESQRAANGQGEQRRLGIYLGAFGWVENLRPLPKAFLAPDALPSSLRPKDANPILEEDEVSTAPDEPQGSRRGGFTHAPSLNHAAAAALLRSAYLSHASPAQADIFSVNLSSERVRRAEFILEGMRNGQPVEALLGYQFERGLHDQTSASAASGDTPVLELNEFILPYRQAFPFEAREIVQAGTGGPSPAMPAYSVVNGLALGDATLTAANAYGLSAVLTPPEQPNAPQGNAILTERDRMLDTLDAVKDLLLAENAYQLVRGNFDRVAAVSLAQKDPRVPPELEVTNTPRGSKFTFTNRVTLHFDDLDPSEAASNPWPAVPLTPRATAETGMNFWLGSVIGSAPDKIACRVYWVQKGIDNPAKQNPRHITLADLQIQPIDFVWMINSSPEETGGATEFEARIAYIYRRTYGIANEEIVRIEFNSPPPGGKSFAQLFPLVRQLRALLAGSRALHAGDFLPVAGSKKTPLPADTVNPRAYDAAELRGRIQSGINTLTTLADFLDGATAPTVKLVFIGDPANPADDEVFSGPLGAAFTKLDQANLNFADASSLTVSFLVSDAEVVHQKLRAIANFGIADAFSPDADLTSVEAKTALLDRAHRVARRLRHPESEDGVLDRAGNAMGKATLDKATDQQATLLLEAGKNLFGDNFAFLPKFVCYNEIDIATADSDRPQLLNHASTMVPGISSADVVAEWLQGLARVRPQLHRWEIVQILCDALNDVQLEFRPVQLPYRAQDSWLAVEFPTHDPLDVTKPFGISRDTLSIAAHGTSAFQAGVRKSGLLLDEWTEEIPSSQENTGIAFRFNQPNGTPPQALLLAITPEETGSWNWDDLVGTLTDTLARAKRRAVEPEQLESQGSVWNAFAPALVSEFSALESADVSLDLLRVSALTSLNDFYAAQIKNA